jgi:hypothetical protein
MIFSLSNELKRHAWGSEPPAKRERIAEGAIGVVAPVEVVVVVGRVIREVGRVVPAPVLDDCQPDSVLIWSLLRIRKNSAPETPNSFTRTLDLR